MVAVVFCLIDGKHYARRVDHKAFRWVGKFGNLSASYGSVQLQIALESCAQSHVLCQSDARNGIEQIGCLQRELTVAVQNVANIGELGEVVVHSHNGHHLLSVAIYSQTLVLKHVGVYTHFGHLAYLVEQWVVGRSRLALRRHKFNLWVEVGEERRHEVVESVEHAQHNHQCHGAHSHAYHRNG